MRVMSAGEGYRYLLKSVAAADGDRPLGSSLTNYYSQTGTPPGRWLGSGVAEIGDGWIAPGNIVTEDQLALLLGQGRDPITAEPLGRAFPVYASRQDRVAARVEQLDNGLSADRREAAVRRIEVEEAERPVRRAVAGYDLTFSVPKSVSVMWALADPETAEQIVGAHHAAVADVVGLMERQVAATRAGANAADGAVAQVAVSGLIATAFDHYDSRAGDPQLHTHVVVSNKVRTAMDGKWRSLDGRPLHAAGVALSEHYNATLADHLTRTLGVSWEARQRGRDRNPSWEITGVPETLIETFSTRSQSIEVETDRLVTDYITRHGYRPTPATIVKLREQATLATRPDKTVQSLADLSHTWTAAATDTLGADPTIWAANLINRSSQPSQPVSDRLPEHVAAQVGAQVVAVVGEKRSTWRHWNLHAEATRQTMGMRFASHADREQALDQIVASAKAASVRLTPPELAVSPPEFQRADGTSVFRPSHATVFTSSDLLAAEGRLLDRGRSTTAPTVMPELIQHVGANPETGQVLGEDQLNALTAVVSSGRRIDVLVGPAGAGKTTAMNALRIAWERQHGPGSVVGLAPSAAAAQVLADDLGIDTENTAKWLHDHRLHRTAFRPGQLVIIDEASLAGTRSLDAITGHAEAVGAKVLLVGDWAQLAAVDAGGGFGMLVRDQSMPPELTNVRRFNQPWEADASLRLRHGDTTAIDTYSSHGRIHNGDSDAMVDRAYQAWQSDVDSGRRSVLIAQTATTVTALNTRARHHRIRTGQVDPSATVSLRDGTAASVGDEIITRRNNRRLTSGRGWVKNGDRWTITATHQDGSISATHGNGGVATRLPAEYVAEHVDLGYAITAHRAQGATVDTGNAIIEPGMTRETLYVAMSRGRQANTAYVTTDQPDIEPHQQIADDASGRAVLLGVLARVGAEESAHETLRAEQHRWASIAQLAAEYETLAAAAQLDRWTALLHRTALTSQQVETVTNSSAFGPLAAAIRETEAMGHDPDRLLTFAVESRPLDGAEDPAGVLHHRVQTVLSNTAATRDGHRSRTVAGLIPAVTGPVASGMREALPQRAALIEQRAAALASTAIAEGATWVRNLGPPPHDRGRRRHWLASISTIAAYRDRYDIQGDDVLVGRPHTTSQARDAARVAAEIEAARRTANTTRKPQQPTPGRQRRTGPTL